MRLRRRGGAGSWDSSLLVIASSTDQFTGPREPAGWPWCRRVDVRASERTLTVTAADIFG